jgi:hypothetical protein
VADTPQFNLCCATSPGVIHTDTHTVYGRHEARLCVGKPRGVHSSDGAKVCVRGMPRMQAMRVYCRVIIRTVERPDRMPEACIDSDL